MNRLFFWSPPFKFFSLFYFLARKQFPKRKLDSRSDGEREKEEDGKETEGGQESKRAKTEIALEKMGETDQTCCLWLFVCLIHFLGGKNAYKLF